MGAVKRKEVYATSGPRILLWFDLLNDPYGEKIAMGSETRMNKNPRFVVKAAGSFKQKRLSEYSFNALGSEEVKDFVEMNVITPQMFETK